MKNINKEKIYILLILFLSVFAIGYFLWVEYRPVKIIAVHQQDNFSDALVRNFPFTDNEKIDWWVKNKEKLKVKYHIPKPASDGFFSVTFWIFGDGYKENEYDRLCFDDINTNRNCIDKNAVFSVRKNKDNTMIFITYDGKYILEENGKIIKVR